MIMTWYVIYCIYILPVFDHDPHHLPLHVPSHLSFSLTCYSCRKNYSCIDIDCERRHVMMNGMEYGKRWEMMITSKEWEEMDKGQLQDEDKNENNVNHMHQDERNKHKRRNSKSNNNQHNNNNHHHKHQHHKNTKLHPVQNNSESFNYQTWKPTNFSLFYLHTSTQPSPIHIIHTLMSSPITTCYMRRDTIHGYVEWCTPHAWVRARSKQRCSSCRMKTAIHIQYRKE